MNHYEIIIDWSNEDQTFIAHGRAVPQVRGGRLLFA
jgi:predicted RNase H-like HicB family nuclease